MSWWGALAAFHLNPPRHACQHAWGIALSGAQQRRALKPPPWGFKSPRAPKRPTLEGIRQKRLKGGASAHRAPRATRASALRATRPQRGKETPPKATPERIGQLRRIERLVARRRPPFGRPADEGRAGVPRQGTAPCLGTRRKSRRSALLFRRCPLAINASGRLRALKKRLRGRQRQEKATLSDRPQNLLPTMIPLQSHRHLSSTRSKISVREERNI